MRSTGIRVWIVPRFLKCLKASRATRSAACNGRSVLSSKWNPFKLAESGHVFSARSFYKVYKLFHLSHRCSSNQHSNTAEDLVTLSLTSNMGHIDNRMAYSQIVWRILVASRKHCLIIRYWYNRSIAVKLLR